MHYEPYLKLPEVDSLKKKKIERPFDILKIKDDETIFSPLNNKIVLEFTKIKGNIQEKTTMKNESI